MKLLNRNFDTGGMSSARMLRQQLLGKARPLWCFSYDLELKHVLSLVVRQYLGYPIAYLTLRYNRQWQKFLSGWRRLRQRPKSR